MAIRGFDFCLYSSAEGAGSLLKSVAFIFLCHLTAKKMPETKGAAPRITSTKVDRDSVSERPTAIPARKTDKSRVRTDTTIVPTMPMRMYSAFFICFTYFFAVSEIGTAVFYSKIINAGGDNVKTEKMSSAS